MSALSLALRTFAWDSPDVERCCLSSGFRLLAYRLKLSAFRFQLTRQEYRSVLASLNSSQDAMSSRKHRGTAYLPWAFTEHGAIMAANVLRSSRAIEMSIYVVRAFIRQREALATNQAILRRLAEIDRTLLEHDSALQILWRKLQPLLAPPPERPKRRIGFHQSSG